MALLQLYFENSGNTELVRTIFSHPSVGARRFAVRGKSEGPFECSGSFQWTPAVRAMCVLLVTAKSLAIKGATKKANIQARTKGAVSAFDYAIGRHTQWIQDIFGNNIRGESLSRRIFIRSNPERKRPGPTTIALNERFLPISEIEIFLNNQVLSHAPQMNKMAAEIISQGNWSDSIETTIVGDLQDAVITGVDWIGELAHSFTEEAMQMLQSTNIFAREHMRQSISQLRETPLLSRVSSQLTHALAETHLQSSATRRLGLGIEDHFIRKTLFKDGPLNFGVTPSQVGTIALLRYLRDKKGYPIEINFSYNHTKDLADAIDSGDSMRVPECCVMTTASYSLLSKNSIAEYHPVMVMPSATHALLAAGKQSKHQSIDAPANYLLLNEYPTTPALWLHSLAEKGHIKKSSMTTTHVEPDEALNSLLCKDPSLRAILWFPYNVIVSQFSSATSLTTTSENDWSRKLIQNVLFVRSPLREDPRRLQILATIVSDAWLTLLEQPMVCSHLVNAQLGEQEYRKYLWRYSGLYNVFKTVNHFDSADSPKF